MSLISGLKVEHCSNQHLNMMDLQLARHARTRMPQSFSLVLAWTPSGAVFLESSHDEASTIGFVFIRLG